MLTGYYLAKKRLQNTQARDRKFLVGAAVNSDARANIFACMHSTYYNLCVRDISKKITRYLCTKKRQEADPTFYTRGQITLTTTKQNTK